ncbi:MAG: radical SAM family heme chaperone HemW [Sulfurimonadaceae bacterium]|jgi:oxygen-independent coproporphyrinogen-3 oxidase|nr:radical SAM family heme chaperone HemW [Sulfurimonadaceae bacterium]
MLLYIHIPFCDSKCFYCAFNSYVDKFEQRASYMEALYKQLSFELERFQATPNSIETVFIGGGTPSCVSPAMYENIFTLIKPYLIEGAEITSEANPNSATKEWLNGMFTLGVNRISFGVQSFDDTKLKLLNRSHTKAKAIEAITHAKEVGFANISLDIIYAVLGDTKELLENDLSIAFSLPINHISAYALTIEEDTLFEKKPQMSKEKLSMTKSLFDSIKKHGFSQYEISNFGTYQSRHNIGYWEYKDYIGAGSGAVGMLGATRFYPSKDIEKYIAHPLLIEEELLTEEDRLTEKIFLGMRSFVGIEKEHLNKSQKKQAEVLLAEGKIKEDNGKYINKNYLLADEIALFLLV